MYQVQSVVLSREVFHQSFHFPWEEWWAPVPCVQIGESFRRSTVTEALHQTELHNRVRRQKHLLSTRCLKTHLEFVWKGPQRTFRQWETRISCLMELELIFWPLSLTLIFGGNQAPNKYRTYIRMKWGWFSASGNENLLLRAEYRLARRFSLRECHSLSEEYQFQLLGYMCTPLLTYHRPTCLDRYCWQPARLPKWKSITTMYIRHSKCQVDAFSLLKNWIYFYSVFLPH